MANPEHVKIVKQGAAAIAAWREENPETRLDLSGADLREANFVGADLIGANLSGANLSLANLSHAFLCDANLNGADLSEADMSRADLVCAALTQAMLKGVDLTGAFVRDTVFGGTDLRETKGLGEVNFRGPCTIGVDTLMKSQGKISEVFLRGCGLRPWEILAARIYDPHLTALEIADIQAESFRLRTEGPIFIGGVFISYAREDSAFVDKVHGKLQRVGVNAWLDKHDVVAGPIDRQIIDAIRLHDIMLVVLSKNSVDRRWLQHEISTACKREEKEKRTILCPIALDDSWKAKEGVDWSQLRQKAVLDFSVPHSFDTEFQKLLDGMKKYYPKE